VRALLLPLIVVAPALFIPKGETWQTRDGDLSITLAGGWKSAPHREADLFLTHPNGQLLLAYRRPLPWNARLSELIDAWVADSGAAVTSRRNLPFGERLLVTDGAVVRDCAFLVRRSFAWELRHVRRADEPAAEFDGVLESAKLGKLAELPVEISFAPQEGREALFLEQADALLAEVRPAGADAVPEYKGTAGAYVRGLWFLRLNDPARATMELKKVLDDQPRLAAARALYADAVRRIPTNTRDEIERNAATALAEAAMARGQDPSIAWSYLVVAQVERRSAYLENPKGVSPENVERVLTPIHTAAELPDPPPELWRLRAEVGEALKLHESAMIDYGRWLETHPTDRDARERRDKLRTLVGARPVGADPFAEGLRRYRLHDFRGAMEAFLAARDTPSLRRFRARTASRLGDWIKVAEDTTSILRDGEDAECRELRAWAYYSLSKWTSAAQDFEALLKGAPRRESELRSYVEACRAR